MAEMFRGQVNPWGWVLAVLAAIMVGVLVFYMIKDLIPSKSSDSLTKTNPLIKINRPPIG